MYICQNNCKAMFAFCSICLLVLNRNIQILMILISYMCLVLNMVFSIQHLVCKQKSRHELHNQKSWALYLYYISTKDTLKFRFAIEHNLSKDVNMVMKKWKKYNLCTYAIYPNLFHLDKEQRKFHLNNTPNVKIKIISHTDTFLTSKM